MKLAVYPGTGSPGSSLETRVRQSHSERARDFRNHSVDTSWRWSQSNPSKQFTFQETARPHEIEFIKKAVLGDDRKVTESTPAPVIESHLGEVFT